MPKAVHGNVFRQTRTDTVQVARHSVGFVSVLFRIVVDKATGKDDIAFFTRKSRQAKSYILFLSVLYKAC